jgi:protease-4
MRIVEWDIVRFSVEPHHVSPVFLEGYKNLVGLANRPPNRAGDTPALGTVRMETRSMTLLKEVRALGLAGLVGLWAAVAAPAQDKLADAVAQEKPAGNTKARTEAPAKPKVVVFRLNQTLTEKPGEDLSALFGSGSVSLRDLVERMKRAADDAQVKAVVLLFDGGDMGYAQVEELRQAMSRLKEKGKPVYAHADELSTGSLVLLSGAARLSTVPTADVWLTGMYGEAPYLRGLLDKLGVVPDYLTCGDYKSAAEIFMRTGPSPEAERMENWLFDSIFETSVGLIAEGRRTTPEQVKAWIDDGPYTAETACEVGILDAVEHRQDLEALLKKEYGDEVVFDRKYGKKEEPKPDFSSPLGIFRFWGELLSAGAKKVADEKPAVGIVYVQGPILLGSEQGLSLLGEEVALSSRVRRAPDDAAADDTIKAVVLRVDSPGGSAVASEIILDATRRVKAKKPFVVSMGNVAGSGGYYVACASDLIFADRSTITASIGVVGGKFATEALFDKLGIEFHPYKRGKNAGLLASGQPFTQDERAKLQSWMDEIYETFRGHVTAVRAGRLKKPLDELAGGRVFTGAQALELG